MGQAKQRKKRSGSEISICAIISEKNNKEINYEKRS